jgi:hypothetical protein
LLTASLLAETELPKGLSAGDWGSIRQAYETTRHAAVADGPGAVKARNFGQQWMTRMDGQGFLVQPDGGAWRWGLTLERYGFAGHEVTAARGRNLSSQGNRVRVDRGGLEEWWVNDAGGLEHGFVIHQRPAGAGAEPLRLEMAVRGGLQPKVTGDGQGASFLTEQGAAVVNYGGLKVWDATGRLLSARMEAGSGKLAILVYEQEAHYPLTVDPTAQQAYLKASNSAYSIYFGSSLAISGDTVVVGAPYENSNATGVNGNQEDYSATDSGAAYVFVRSGGTWTQQAYLKASNTGEDDSFGGSVAISGDTVVVGAVNEDSNATGVNGNQGDNSLRDSGAAYVFVRSGSTWTQQAYLKASNSGRDLFGFSVAVSGGTVVVGAPYESSNATGVNGNQADNSARDSGAAYVFVRSGGTWTQQAYLKASNTGEYDYFGYSVAISGDTVVVGAVNEDSNATGVNGNQADNSASQSGAAYVFLRSGGTWSQQAYLKASNTGANDNFGGSVAISVDTVVVGAVNEDSNATGVNGNQADNSASQSGAAYVFLRSGGTWSQQAYLKASNTEWYDDFGWRVAISGDTVVVGAPYEDSNSVGVNGHQGNNYATTSGAAYVFVRSGSSWTQQSYLKASNTWKNAMFGSSVAVSGGTVVVGAPLESSNATGVNGNETHITLYSGAAYVFNLQAPPPPPSPVEFVISPQVVQWSCVTGRTPPSSVLRVEGSGGFTLAAQHPWLVPANSSGTPGRPFTLGLQNCDLAPGHYSSQVYFRVGSAEAAVILVQLTVSGVPELFSTPGQINFTREVGAPEPAAQRLWIVARNVNVSYTHASASPWLEIVNAGTRTPQQIEVRPKQPPTEVGVYRAEIVVSSAEAVNGPLRIPVTYTVSPAVPQVSGGVYDYFTLTNGTVARGALATVFGLNLADSRNLLFATPYPLVLGGVVVKINGVPCPVFYTDPAQLAFQVPADAPLGPVKLVVERNGVASADVPLILQ